MPHRLSEYFLTTHTESCRSTGATCGHGRGGRRGRGGGTHRCSRSRPLAADAYSVARRCRLRARGPHGLVRGPRRGLSLRSRQKRTAHRRDQDRTRSCCRNPPAHRHPGAPLQDLHVGDAIELEPLPPGRRKAEWTQGEANPRFVVTSMARKECSPKYLYASWLIEVLRCGDEPARYSARLRPQSRSHHAKALCRDRVKPDACEAGAKRADGRAATPAQGVRA